MRQRDSRGFHDQNSSTVAATLTRMPSQTCGDFIATIHQSGPHHPIDGDTPILVGHLEPLPTIRSNLARPAAG